MTLITRSQLTRPEITCWLLRTETLDQVNYRLTKFPTTSNNTTHIYMFTSICLDETKVNDGNILRIIWNKK